MKKEVGLTKEEQNILLDVLFGQNYASEILAAEITDIETGLKRVDISQYKQMTRLFNRLKNEGY